MGSMNNAISRTCNRIAWLRLLALAWALIAACACGKPEPEPAAQGPAGKVEGGEGRVTAVRAAAGAQPRGRGRGAVLAYDAFCPFGDGLEEAEAAGVTAVVETGGSMRDEAGIDAADRLGVALVFTGARHFRH